MVGGKVVSEKVRKIQTGEGRGEPEGRRLMQMLSDEGRGDARFI